MIDSNERLTYLDTRHTTELSKRVIQSVIDNYTTMKSSRPDVATDFVKDKIESLRNTLFIKYTGIEFESLFQSIYVDQKMGD